MCISFPLFAFGCQSLSVLPSCLIVLLDEMLISIFIMFDDLQNVK